jgi:hypothetical protein
MNRRFVSHNCCPIEKATVPAHEWVALYAALTQEHERTVLMLVEQRDAARATLGIAEAALADIGDADREPGDDLAWCEQRAAQALPAVRAFLSTPTGDAK